MPKKVRAQMPVKTMETLSPTLSPGGELGTRFSPMLQGGATNTLTKTSVHKTPPNVDEITGLATINNEGLTIFIEGYDKLAGGLRVSTHKLLDLCTLQLTQQNDYRGKGVLHTAVDIALDDYIEALGIPHTKASKDKARRRVKEDLETLYSTSLEWQETGTGPLGDFAKTRICTMVGIRRGRIQIDFTNAFTSYLTSAYIMQYPRAILQISEKFSNSYHLGRKLLLHHSIDSNQRRGTASIISIRSLLENAPELPSFAQVRATDRAYTRRIIEPFERDMNALHDFLRWNYCNAKGKPLTEDQLAHFSYEVFSTSYVYFEVDDFPDPAERLERKERARRKEKK